MTVTMGPTTKIVEKPEPVQQRNGPPPPVDIHESPDELLLIADMPGARAHQLEVHMNNNELTIVGLRTPAKHPLVLLWEFEARDYWRTLVVPPGIDEDKIEAETKDGVLRLELRKSKAVKPRQIGVQSG